MPEELSYSKIALLDQEITFASSDENGNHFKLIYVMIIDQPFVMREQIDPWKYKNGQNFHKKKFEPYLLVSKRLKMLPEFRAIAVLFSNNRINSIEYIFKVIIDDISDQEKPALIIYLVKLIIVD